MNQQINIKTILLFVGLIGGSSAYCQSLTQGKLHACKIDGIEDSLFGGQLSVYENRELSTGRKINLNILVIPALHPESSGAPIFYIDGGPGVAATNSASFFADHEIAYRHYHDIVLVDVRGTGGSNALNCTSLQETRSLAEQLDDMYPIEAVKSCYDSLFKIADLTQYTTTHVVNDLEEVRKWLGYDKIHIYGLSYGTRVCLTYMKMFPEVIESSILWSPVPTYARMPLYHARYAQNSIDSLFKNCSLDSLCHAAFPDIQNEFVSLMYRMQENPPVYSYTDGSGHSTDIIITWNAFQTKIRSLMYTPDGLREIPFIVHEMYAGNAMPFISLFPSEADTNNFIAEGFYLCITCSEDLPYIQESEIDSLTKQTFMGTYRIEQQQQACAQWARGFVPADFFNPTVSAIPTLIFTGPYDPVTPVAMAKEIASHLSQCTLIVIPEMSHTFDGLSNADCFDTICLNFINNPTNPIISSDCVKEMIPGPYKVK